MPQPTHTCADDGLNFDEKQKKYDKLREKAEDYAARVFQCCARCKMAKRHLLREVQHWNEKKRARPVRAESPKAAAARAVFENPLDSEGSVSDGRHTTRLVSLLLARLACCHPAHRLALRYLAVP